VDNKEREREREREREERERTSGSVTDRLEVINDIGKMRVVSLDNGRQVMVDRLGTIDGLDLTELWLWLHNTTALPVRGRHSAAGKRATSCVPW